MELTASTLNGLRVSKRYAGGLRFVQLSRELWRSCGRCDCPHCQGKEGFWDTLAIPAEGTTYTCHFPDLFLK